MSEYITKEELESMKKELEELKGPKTKEIAEAIRYAASFGDLSENFAYQEAKDRQQFLQGRIIELTEKIRSAKIIEKVSGDNIQIGSLAVIKLDGEEQQVKIVSPGQSDPLKGNISYESPIGKALIGKAKGDKFKIELEGGDKLDCEILKVE